MKKRTKVILGSLFILLIGLNLTIPTQEDYYEWLADEYAIEKK